MAADHSIGTPEQLRDPDYTPPLATALPLGIQHVLAMFVSNITPAIIVAGAAGFGFGTPGVFDLIYMIQMSLLFAGIATLFQTIGMGPVAVVMRIKHDDLIDRGLGDPDSDSYWIPLALEQQDIRRAQRPY